MAGNVGELNMEAYNTDSRTFRGRVTMAIQRRENQLLYVTLMLQMKTVAMVASEQLHI